MAKASNSYTSTTAYSYGTKTLGRHTMPSSNRMATSSYGSKGLRGPVGVTGSSGPSSYNYIPDDSRDSIRGTEGLKYGSTFLSQDRVEQVFDFDLNRDFYYGGDEAEDCEKSSERDAILHDVVEQQLSLSLESIDEVEARLVRQIKKYRRATDSMAACALLWWDLMTDLQENPHLAEEFHKFQMLRKLSGGTL